MILSASWVTFLLTAWVTLHWIKLCSDMWLTRYTTEWVTCDVWRDTHLLLEHVEVVDDDSNEEVESEEWAADDEDDKVPVGVEVCLPHRLLVQLQPATTQRSLDGHLIVIIHNGESTGSQLRVVTHSHSWHARALLIPFFRSSLSSFRFQLL